MQACQDWPVLVNCKDDATVPGVGSTVEARSRMGGRVQGGEDTRANVDMGGALIHGTYQNPLSQLCVQLNWESQHRKTWSNV